MVGTGRERGVEVRSSALELDGDRKMGLLLSGGSGVFPSLSGEQTTSPSLRRSP